MARITIEVPFLPPGEISPNARESWVDKHAGSSQYRRTVWLCALNERNKQNIDYPMKKPRLNLVFVFAHSRRRDEDNLRTRFKPGLDGLVDAGLLPDDNPAHLVTGDMAIEVDPSRAPLTVITLEETDD